MSDNGIQTIVKESIPSLDAGFNFLNRLLDVARPAAVFAEPVHEGEVTIITAAEVYAAAGFAHGGGGGFGESPVEVNEDAPVGGGAGSGGGGGGSTGGRPVAAIIIEGNSVRVEPIVDPTKIVLAFFTTLAAIFSFGAKIRRQRS